MHRPPNIVGVGGSSAKVLGYVDVSVVISDVEVRHPLIVVDELAYPLLIGTNVLRPHRANFKFGAPYVVQLKLDMCPVSVVEERLPDATPRVIVGAVASTLADTTLPPHYAARVQVRLPPKYSATRTFSPNLYRTNSPMQRALCFLWCARLSVRPTCCLLSTCRTRLWTSAPALQSPPCPP